MLQPLRLSAVDHHVCSDASGGFGCGAIRGVQWLQSGGPIRIPSLYSSKVAHPIMMACMVWGHSWQGQVVHIHHSATQIR